MATRQNVLNQAVRLMLAGCLTLLAGCVVVAPLPSGLLPQSGKSCASQTTSMQIPPPLALGVNQSLSAKVGLTQQGSSFSLSVQLVDSATGAIGARFDNTGLVPVAEPISACRLSSLLLRAQVDGFSVLATYPHDQGADHFELRFVTGSQSPESEPYLVEYRKQVTNASGIVVSGIVADLRQGLARWLGAGNPAGQGARSELPPVPLLNPSPVKLSFLPALYSYVPEVKATIRNEVPRPKS